MTLLVLGLVLFLGTHSIRIVAGDWRARQIARLGSGPWKGLYSLTAAVGFALIVWGYGLTRTMPVDLWVPATWTRHLAALLTLVSFVLLAASQVPGTRLKARLGHPMVLGVKVWALAHLLSNGRLGDVVLFGAFLVWAVLDFRSARRRDRAEGVVRPAGKASRDVVAIVAGIVLWGVFAFALHGWLMGVRPFA